jgi:transposase
VVDGDDDEEAETEDRCGAEGEDRLGGAAGAGDGGGPGGASPGSSEPDLCWSAKRRRSLKKQLLDNAARAFDPGVGIDAEEAREREIEKLHAKIGQLTVENSFLARRSGR